jgi:serine protease
MAKRKTGRRAAGPRRPVAAPTPPKSGYRERVVVKFRDFVDLPYVDGVESVIKKRKLAPWDRLAKDFPGITLRRLFSTMTGKRLTELQLQATRLDPTYRPPDLLTYFSIVCPPNRDPRALSAALRAWAIVEFAYVDPQDAPAAVPIGTNPLYTPPLSRQTYLTEGPVGISAEYAWPLPGGSGEGQRAIDIERAYLPAHEDLRPAIVKLFGDFDNSAGNPEHGTEILGVVSMVDNNRGGVGIAFNVAKINFMSPWSAATMAIDRAAAIMAAVGHFTLPVDNAFGRVIMIPLQTKAGVDLNVSEGMPIEVLPPEFAAIRLATALGIIVVEAAGNGTAAGAGHDLDLYQDANGKFIFNRNNATDFADSGAIMVGGATAGAMVNPVRARVTYANSGNTYASSYGSRVDCFGWGMNVATSTTDAGFTTNAYTLTFDGTSSATAVVGGAVLVTQGMIEAGQGYRLSSWQMRAFLTEMNAGVPTHGTPSNDPPNDRIGIMPDLHKIADSLGVVPDLYMRDFVGDNGDPHAGAISASPDVILRPAQVANPTASFGVGSGNENNDALGFTATAGQDNYIYVRVLNRAAPATAAAAAVTATVYWSTVASLITPNNWTLVGNVVLPNVPEGNQLAVSNAVVWPAANVPGPGHYCLIGLVGNALDPAPGPGAFPDWNSYYQFIRQNNNITWRNFNVV